MDSPKPVDAGSLDAQTVSVLHVVTDGTLDYKRDILRELVERGTSRFRHFVAHVGPSGRRTTRRTDMLVSAPPFLPWIGIPATRRIAERHDVSIVHVWSPDALRVCAPLADGQRSLMIESDVSFPAAPLARWRDSCDSSACVGFVCPTALAQRRLAEKGISVDSCPLIREFVDFAQINAARAADLRPGARLGPADKVIVALPPIERVSGHFTAIWAALIAQVVRGDLRIVVPGRTDESSRLRGLIRSTPFAQAARFTADRFSLPELLAVADLAVFLPSGDAPVSALAWAMASGTPILASAVRAVAELLADRHNAWLCRADSPRAAARKILHAIESPLASRDLATRARTQAFEVFGRQRMIRQYERAYSNLRRGEPAASGITDSAIVQ